MCFQFSFVLLVALQVGSNLVEAQFDYGDGEPFYDSSKIIEIPQSCKGKPFCFEKGEDYPSEMIDKLVKDLRNMEVEDPEARISIGSTDGQLECKTNYNDGLIYYITDTNNKQRVVVQSQAEEHFRQYYTLTWCSKEGPTNTSLHDLKGTKCVTQNMEVDFFVLSENYVFDNPKMTVARAKIPVCCRCVHDSEEYNRDFEQTRQYLMTMMKNGN